MADYETRAREIVFDICAQGWRYEMKPDELLFEADQFEKFAFDAIAAALKEAIAAETERCAKICADQAERLYERGHVGRGSPRYEELIEAAAAIRSKTESE